MCGRACIVLAAALGPRTLSAQQLLRQSTVDSTAKPGQPRLVSGRIVRPGTKDLVPVVGVWVTLHRVGSDTQGPVDSVRSGPGGRYSFHYHITGRPDAVYFVAASYDGIAYFSTPLTKPSVTGADAEIAVFDTTSGPVPLHIRGRHIVLSAPAADGTRQVVEVYELSNDTTVTLIAPDDAHPTWTATLPPGAANFQVGQSDVSPRAITADSGRVLVTAPFAPGLKQLSFAFTLPAADFPLSVPMLRPVTVLEVLAEEPRTTVSGTMRPTAPANIEGRTFARWLGQDLPAGTVVTIVPPTAPGGTFVERHLTALILALAGAMVLTLVVALSRRRGSARVPAPAPAPASRAAPSPEAERIAREIAELDAAFAARTGATPADRRAHDARREELKRALARALDARRGPA